ncbi:two-component system sensor histidine kinase/response regulator [Paenibacillus phyllosphaerae]|uniref:Circadian input-output histidine kinase CikA n=1 Tax=Paenibacillus phyllosphaerae TaxID=274593 RepID=A0A7W5B0L1_9BACL|nr:PAS domain S-box protein [Paenibacillus phyllosphaerae]MBB3112192.1 two-component system sensor histidine kinase/response regulator [Paenibacillus phyllosphaerae]
MKHVSLRIKFLVLIILITSIPLILVGMSTYTTAQSTITEALVEKAYSKVRNNADNLSGWLNAMRSEIEGMSRVDIIRHGTDEERKAYLHIEASRAPSPYTMLAYASLYDTLEMPNGAKVGPWNKPWQDESRVGQATLTDPFVSLYSTHPYILIQVPVYGQDDAMIGAVYAAIDTKKMYEQYLNFRVGLSDEVIMYNAQGNLLYHPDMDYELKANLNTPELSYSKIAVQMLDNQRGYTEVKADNHQYMVFYSDVGLTHWKIGLRVAMNEFDQPLTSLFWQTVGAILLAEVVMTLLLWQLMNRLVIRIKRVLAVTEAASAGQFDTMPVPDDGGDEISQLSQSVNDMTVHLREMFDRLEAIINQNEYSIIGVDEEYRITYFNKAAERMLGYRAEEVLHQATPLLYMDPDNLREAAEALSLELGRTMPLDVTLLRELRRNQVSYEREWVLVHKDGTRIPVMHSSSAIRDRDGNTVGVVGISRDITKQKQEESIRNRLLAVLESAHDLIATFDQDCRLVYLNPAGRAMLGLEHETDLESALHDEVPASLEEALLSGMDYAQAHGYHESVAHLHTLDSRIIHVSKIIVTHEAAGEIFYSCIARDITETTRVYEELGIAKREAEEANQAKTVFLARMSHEIRTPLAGIIGLTRLLQKTELTPLQRDYADKTHSASEALLRIINDILDFSKVEAGKVELNAVSFNLEELLQKLGDILSVFVGGKEQFEFLIDLPRRLPAALIGDPLRLEQVLLNLCGNAVKFTNRGHVLLRIELPASESDGDVAVRFIIEDTGIGISQEQQSRLFESFSQGNAGTQRKYGGSGLGLVIAKSLVEMMGGAITFESVKGEGSRFEFTLNFAIQSSATSEAYQIGEYAVWVVEDYPLAQEHSSAMLEEMGLLPIVLPSWRLAFDRLKRAGIGALPDAVVLDFEMPDMYDDDTWHSFHAEAVAAGVSTVALTTTFGREELLKLPAEDRPDAILVKPVTRLTLYRALLPILKLHGNVWEAQEEPASEEREVVLPKGNILLAEDNAINQLVAVEQLREWGFTVEVAETGHEVLNKLEQRRWDLILMDIHMPEMDGDEAAAIIRTDARFDDLPIIALTANVIRQDHERYLQIGMNDVLTKPLQTDKMLHTVLKWIKPKEQEAAYHEAAAALETRPIAESEEAIALPTVPGIDMSAALARVSGKREILRHMLNVFVTDSGLFEQRFAEAIAERDYATARRLAHTLKGVAGNLSAAELAALADQLETLLKLPAEQIDLKEVHSTAACVYLVLKPMLAALSAK